MISKDTTKKMILVIVLYYIVTSVFSILFGGLQSVLHIPEVVIQTAQFGPAVGVLAVLLVFRNKYRSIIAARFSTQPYVVKRFAAFLGITVIIFALAIAAYKIFGEDAHYTHPGTLAYPLWLIVIAQFVGSAGEELGWRAFLQPYLQTRLSVLASSVIVGLLWGLWHVGVFAEGMVYASAFLLSAVALSVIMGEILRGARGANLLLATCFHTFINIGLLLFLTEEAGDEASMITFSALCAVVAIAVVGYCRLRNNSSPVPAILR